MTTLGTNVKTARRKAGLTQQELAVAAGLAVATVARIETDRHEPRLATLKALAGVLRVSIVKLAP